MVINNEGDFYKKIDEEPHFFNTTINLSDIILIINRVNVSYIYFENCEFNCKLLVFKGIENPVFKIRFYDCTFNCGVSFHNCMIDSLDFLNTKKIESLTINGNLNDFKKKSQIISFRFSNETYEENDSEKENKIVLSTSFSFFNVLFKKYFEFNSINNSNGIFSFDENIIGDIEFEQVSSCVFQSSYISNARFSDNVFNTYANFKNSCFLFNKDNFKNTGSHWNESKFWNNQFQKVDFSEVEFINNMTFDKCDFLSTTWYEKCKNINNSNLKFVACEFKGFVLFNRSTLKFLNIDRCTFDKSVSFTEAFFIKIKLFEVKFNGGAYFDEMRIKNVDNKSYLRDKDILDWKRTLRAIKQELQKTENKIDFNRFRAYELAAHYEELGWGWKSGFKDKFILWATKWSTDFGNSWRRSLAFTLLSGLFWYSVFFYFDFYLTGNYKYYFNTNYSGIFGNGYFRFLLVTDFYNPLVEDRTYIQNFLSWIPFIFGKIFIAFGIYEMIQSFRKFKA